MKKERASAIFKTKDINHLKAYVLQYQHVQFIPELVVKIDHAQDDKNDLVDDDEIDRNRGDPFENLTNDETLKKLFINDLCTLLRILYSGAAFRKNHLDIKHLLNDKIFMNQIKFAGWNPGFLSSKLLGLIK